jgi:protein O-GlcNAc transferase
MTMVTIHEALERAKKSHQAGQLAEAERIYRQILAQEPRQPDAMHRLGVLAFQVGNKEAGLALVGQAIEINPAASEYHSNRGMILASMGRWGEALDSYRRAIQLHENYPEVHNNLGNALRALGRNDEAIAALRRAMEIRPDYPEAHNNLGIVLQSGGKLDEAIESFRRALELKPDFAEACKNLGGALAAAGKWEEAIYVCRRATGLRLRDATAYVNLGYALHGAGRSSEAVAAYRQALALDANSIEAMNGLGNAFLLQVNLEEAAAAYRQALARDANHAESHFNLGVALRGMEKTEEAIAEFWAAIAARPNFVQAINNLGLALQAQGKLEEAIECYRKAIELKPDHANACNNLGNALKDCGRLDEAISAYSHAVEMGERNRAAGRADDVRAASNRLFAIQYHPLYPAAAILREARAWNQRYARPPAGEIRAHENDRDPERRLRVGYVSPDFRNHCQSHFTIPLLSNHDHERFEIFCYARVARSDEWTKRIQEQADVWRSTIGMSDGGVAQSVREDKIDILVDLTMHMANGRPLLFARKPAPVQVAWLAYPGTTGLEAIEYRLTDPYLDPPGMNDAFYSEKSLRLAETFWCYDPLCEGIEPGELPAPGNGYMTFGCLNNFCKVQSQTLKLWGRLLKSVGNSRLKLLCPLGGHRAGIIEQLGVEENRVEFVTPRPREEYLKEYRAIDLALDTLPYNGHTTSLDAFWMGVPVVTLVGETVVGRAGWSQLCNLDLKELAARSEEQFILTAAGLAGDLPRLAEMRAGLRARIEKSPLMDAERFARNVESAYRQMWRNWLLSRGPA